MNQFYQLILGVIFSTIFTNNLFAAPSPSSYTSDATGSGLFQNGFNVGVWTNPNTWNNGVPDLTNNDVNTISVGDSIIFPGSISINNKVTINVDGILVFTGSFSAFNNFTINVASGGKFIVQGSMSVNNGSDAVINGNVTIGGSLTVASGGSPNWSGTGTINIGGTGCDQIPDPFGSSNNCYDVNSPLPVTLKDFIVLLNDNKEADLTWATLTEEDNDYFELQRSTDALTFETIGKIEGNGTSKSIINYSFTDQFPLSGLSYYRLKQVDYDGKSTYHRIIVLVNSSSISKAFYLYPNPTNDIQYFQLQYGVELNKLVLTSVDGNIISLANEQDIIDAKMINYEGIEKGIYILHAYTSKGDIKKRISIK